MIGRWPGMPTEGNPVAEGLYAVEVYHGWQLLGWYDGAWWHRECVGRWTACNPLQWVGPLPALQRTPGQKPTPEFDL